MPVTRPASKVWELCMTINNNWGYRPSDTNWKTPDEVIRIYTEVLGMGGNLLLDIGPRADGTIPAEAEQVLKALGRWNRKHAEAVYGTREGLPYGHYHGSSTLSKDSTALYLFIPSVKGGNQEGQVQVMLKGIRNQVVKCEVLGTSEPIQVKPVGKISWSTVPGTLFMDVPLAGMDEHMTILKLQLDGPLRLYSGKGGFAD
jgi:alpha-L-fucosidase